MKNRILAICAVLLLGLGIAGAPAMAQEEPDDPALTEVTDGLRQILDEAQPLFDGLEPVTDAVGDALTELIAELQPLFLALQDALNELEPTCVVLGPIVDTIQPLIDEIQPILDLLDPDETPEQLAFLSPLLAEVDILIDQVLELCAPAEEPEAEAPPTTEAPAPPPPPPAPAELPRTGGPLGDTAPVALALMGLAGLAYAAQRRLASIR
ncbi:MAG TPA: hypothetical protein VMN58_11340 [Acidimicrobiales bacterium]|nr:hypothetical protein [Acidimicrobiales bacterium]